MKKISFIYLLLISSNLLFGQQTYGDSLSLQVEAQATSSSITLTWQNDADATNFVIYRKLKGTYNWSAPINTISGTLNSYVDATINPNVIYDYLVKMESSTSLERNGYVSSAYELIANSNRGIAIVVISDTYLGSSAYSDRINQYIEDLENDGWFPKRIDVQASQSASDVKALILAKYTENPSQTKLLSLVGNVPVPYSGEINPDGHGDHLGAWPTDAYYADVNGTWTDVSVNNTSSSNMKNHNVPGDGKFDQEYIPGLVELQVGRIDFSDLPNAGASEEELTIRYLDKLHMYKIAGIQVDKRALIDDEFTGYPEGFSQNGYKNFAPLVGRSNIVKADYFSELSFNSNPSSSYLWSYGCGGGWYSGAGGIGSSANFASDSLSSVFTMLFGSYFGDWNYTDGFMKTSLTQGNALTTCWAGRPNWHFYHMGIGDNIGYSAFLTQNNNEQYVSNSTYPFFNKYISLNLLGDPSLRMIYKDQPTNVTIFDGGDFTTLSWDAVSGAIGYTIYRRYDDSTNFLKLNTSLISSLSFQDVSFPTNGLAHYYVKAVFDETTASGNYHNESLGVKQSTFINVSLNENQNSTVHVFPNPFVENLTISSKEEQYIELFDLDGKLLFSTALKSGVQAIELSTLSAGIYLLKTSSPSGKVVLQKIIKSAD